MRQRGVNRVVMLVGDLDAGRAFYEKLLDCTFHSGNDADAESFGVRAAFSWDGGVELVAPIPGAGSHLEKLLERKGEGIIGVVWAVADADRAKAAGEELGVSCFYTLDYDQEQIDADLQGRYTRYYEHFLDGRATPLGDGTILVGEFDVAQE